MTDMEQKDTKTVLLIDDDQFLLDMYAHKFEAQGFAVVKANSADEALERLRAGLVPAAVVFDIVMPHTDGYAFLEIMSREHLAAGAAKIALSNQTDGDEMKRLTELGADGHITKASEIPSEAVAEVLRIIAAKTEPKV